MRRSLVTVLLLLALPLAAEAQAPPPLSLAAAIARAQAASFDVRLSEADANGAAARVLAARAQLLPQIGAAGTVMRGGISQLGMPVAQQTYLSANATVPLFAPADWETARAASLSAHASSLDLASARNDAAYIVTQAYERALLTRAIVASRTATVEYQRRRAADVDERIKAGATPRYERAQAQAVLAGALQMLEDANADADEALADLEFLLDLPMSAGLNLSDPLDPMTAAGTVAVFQGRAALQRPEVLSAQEQVLAAQARLTAARDRYLPIIAGAAQMYAGRSSPDLGPRGYQIGITATLPLVDGGVRAAASMDAKADVDRARIALEKAQRSVERDVANAYREYQAAQRDLELARRQAAASAQELRITILRERSGKGIALETLAAIDQDASARESVLRATARLNDAVAGLYHASGSTLFEREPQ
ncbi:MAG TPA: TolC family protein [Candidatus Baltobacteraceae bacterium]|nr:TolC family protein [Candidatus Baltobacteraceae bacterium]